VNTIILGRILEKVTNESYASLMPERLLKPLGLDRRSSTPTACSSRRSAISHRLPDRL
jgi:CubicO group peptidase (beta-lactamase class C family)